MVSGFLQQYLLKCFPTTCSPFGLPVVGNLSSLLDIMQGKKYLVYRLGNPKRFTIGQGSVHDRFRKWEMEKQKTESGKVVRKGTFGANGAAMALSTAPL